MIALVIILGVVICIVAGYPFRDGYRSGESGTDKGWQCGSAMALVALFLLTVIALGAGHHITLRSYANGHILIEKIPVVTKEIR